jgi:hypothetical protein
MSSIFDNRNLIRRQLVKLINQLVNLMEKARHLVLERFRCEFLRDNSNSAKLSEVMIEGEGGNEFMLFDDAFAGAVRETPIFVSIVAENFPSLPHVLFR